MSTHTIDFEAEFSQYVETALWASIDEQPDGNGGPPMDENYGPEDLAPETIETMRGELADFLNGCDPDVLAFWEAELGAGQVGHDFWLTRNGHGAGFWDRFGRGVGKAFGRYLTEQAEPYGESHLYAGDDGQVYVS